jgi:hypothetical protein
MRSIRHLATLCLAVTLVGCADTPAPTKSKPVDGAGSGATPVNPALSTGPVGPADDTTTRAATDFLRAVGSGAATPTALSTAFLKVVGKPLVFETDVAKGYSTDAAQTWLRPFSGLTFGLPTGTAGGGAAVLSGSFQGDNRNGRYLVRLVQDGGWKVDWFQLSSVKPSTTTPTAGPDGPYQDFAAQAFLDLLADKNALDIKQRATLLAHLLTPELRKNWAAPFSADTKDGYDFSRGQMELKFAEIGAVESYTLGAISDATAKGELTKAVGKKAITLKLTRGTPGQWLVSEFSQN